MLPCEASSPTFLHQMKHLLCLSPLCFLCLFTQTGGIWRNRLHPCVLLHGNLLLQRPVMGTHWGTLHISLIMKRLRKTSHCRGLGTNKKQSTERQIEVLEENLILGDNIRDCRKTNRYSQPLRNTRMRKLAVFSSYFLTFFSQQIYLDYLIVAVSFHTCNIINFLLNEELGPQFLQSSHLAWTLIWNATLTMYWKHSSTWPWDLNIWEHQLS